MIFNTYNIPNRDIKKCINVSQQLKLYTYNSMIKQCVEWVQNKEMLM